MFFPRWRSFNKAGVRNDHAEQSARGCAPDPYCEMCSACVFDSFSMAALMAVMPPSTRMDSVEKLVCAPVPARTHACIDSQNGIKDTLDPLRCSPNTTLKQSQNAKIERA